ncbi:MAG TPA: hypothetical protein VGN14_00220 [Candidatus Elarobacter sp.]|jgi:hypothetical protein
MAQQSPPSSATMQVTLGWIWVGIPLAWGIYQTLLNVIKLFQ